MTDYYVRMNIAKGLHAFEWQSGELVPGDPVQLLDGLVMGWTMPEGLRHPAQPDPMECSFTLRTLAAGELDSLADGVDLAVELYAPDDLGEKVAGFYGRVSDVVVTPSKEGELTWLYYGVQAVDYTADLAETPVQPGSWPAEDLDDRVALRLVPAFPVPWDGLSPVPAKPVLAKDWSGGNLLDALLATLEDVVTEIGPGTPSAMHLVPHADYSTGLGYYLGQLVPGKVIGSADQLPGVPVLEPLLLDGVAIGYELTIDWSTPGTAGDPAPALYGQHVPTASLAFRSAKGLRPNVVAVTGTFGGTEQTLTFDTEDLYGVVPEGPRVQLAISTQLTSSLDALALAAYYLPNPQAVPDSWSVDEFSYLIPQDQLGPVRWLPDHATALVGDYQGTWPYAQPVVLYAIESDKAPTGRTLVSGRFAGVQLVVAGGEVIAKLRVRRGAPELDDGVTDQLTMDDLNALFPDVTDHYRGSANLLGDAGGWETPGSVQGWAGAGNCTIAQNGARAKYGTGALRLTSTVGAGNMAVLSPTMAVVAGQTYCASGWVNPDNAGRTLTLALQWYTAGMVFISQVTSITVPAADAWADLGAAIGVAPGTAAFARIAVQSSLGAVGELTWIDGMQLEAAAVRNPYEGPDYLSRYLNPALSWDDFNLVRNP